ncbi:MAG: D-tyrosyl-tRNA(Tyr) deacylase [Victivallales bacterium]|nr:D-tyrosyl-tRNA(Tyr) deacylase [Victivallales bacterium]
MRVLLQRIKHASVEIDGEVVGKAGAGLLLFLGVGNGDTKAEADFLVEKCVGLRIFEDAEGKMNLSLADVGGEILLISQFTLYADARKGRRPSYTDAAPPPVSEPLYEYFAQRLRDAGVHVETGRFGADMKVSLLNDGPVTIMLEKEHER